MPIVINEMLVKVSITEEESVGGNQTTTGSKDSEVSGTDALVKACVEKVLEIINEKQER